MVAAESSQRVRETGAMFHQRLQPIHDQQKSPSKIVSPVLIIAGLNKSMHFFFSQKLGNFRHGHYMVAGPYKNVELKKKRQR